ncbi:MAG: hypothetical protein ACR2HO_04860 [Rubrobacteraceae bacterium]
MLHQLLGYVLLDYEDPYGIGPVGFYLSHQKTLTQIPPAEMLQELSPTGCDPPATCARLSGRSPQDTPNPESWRYPPKRLNV